MSVVQRQLACWLSLGLSALIAAGCMAASPTTTPPAAESGTPAATGSPGATTIATPSVTSSPPIVSPSPATACAEQQLASMTEAQRIGQLFMLGLIDDRLDAGTRAAIARNHFGSVWYTTHTSAGLSAVRRISDSVQALATDATTNRVPFFVAANQEGGVIQALTGAGFHTIPSALDQGALSARVLQLRAAVWGRELSAAGVNFNFAPVADVVPPGTDKQNAPIGQLRREFGHDPATVSSHVAAFIAGMAEAGVATSAKHFPGLGRVVGNTDFTGSVTDSVTSRGDPYLQPFARAIGSGAPFVMVSLATYKRIDASELAVFSPTVIGTILRGDLKFRGAVISDDMGAAVAVDSIPPGTRATRFLEAGGDMIISKTLDPAITMAEAIAARTAQSSAFRSRVDDAALHVLQAKVMTGLLAC
jgi:beta-N-acetylhexosaminidase